MRKLCATVLATVGALLLLGSWPQIGFAYPFGGEIAGKDARTGDVIGGGSSMKRGATQTPEQRAQASYKSGRKARDKALEAEKKLAASPEAGFWHDRYARAVKKSWAEAMASYRAAIASKPDFFEAYSDLGYAYRKIGDYDRSLAAYGRALEINPEYPNALEYLGEAYLKLGRLDDLKSTYMKLFSHDRELAAVLMKAANEWLDTQPGSLSAEELDAFRQWVAERKQLAEQVGETAQARAW